MSHCGGSVETTGPSKVGAGTYGTPRHGRHQSRMGKYYRMYCKKVIQNPFTDG